MIQTKLNSIVDELLSKFIGGETYFDKLDDALKHPENIDIVSNLFSNLKDSDVIMSGGFGYYVQDLYNKGLITLKSLVVVNGSLRQGEVTKVSQWVEPTLEYVFVDDSFYKGRTRDKVQGFLNGMGCTLKGTVVVYDGSHVKDDTVHSMYRYHK